MSSRAFTRARRLPGHTSTWIGHLFAVASGLLLPVVMVTVGLSTAVLDGRGLRNPSIPLGQYLPIHLPGSFTADPPLNQLMTLVFVGTLLTLLIVFCQGMLYRIVYARVRDVVAQLHHDTLNRCIEHAATEGITAQRRRAEQLIEDALPRLRSGLLSWHRNFPRYGVMLVSCLGLACLVSPVLTAMAILFGALIYLFSQWLRGDDVSTTGNWELEQVRSHLLHVVQQGPMLARLQPGESFATLYEMHLDRLLGMQASEESKSSARIQIVTMLSILAAAVLLLAMGINSLENSEVLSVHAMMVLLLSLGGAALAAQRIIRTRMALAAADDAALAVFHFLDQPTRNDSEQPLGISGLRDCIELTHVTLLDGQQHALAKDVTMRLDAGSMVALLGSDQHTLWAIVELLLGFGKPAAGEALLDGMPICNIHPSALGKHVAWVGSDGPLWTGTIEQNLRANAENVTTVELADAMRKVGVYNLIQEFDDGLHAEISPLDSRLNSQSRYALGVARALLATPAVVIVDEPEPLESDLAGDPCLDALQELVENGSLVVMLPKRQASLKAAQRVILFSSARIAGEGKHDELLLSSELYRHLNYQLFNPYRSL